MSIATLTNENNCLLITGDLDFTSVTPLWESSLGMLDNYSVWNFDLSKVTFSNSAGLALLIEWVKLARSRRKKIIFKNIPDQLLSIANVCSVDGFTSLFNV